MERKRKMPARAAARVEQAAKKGRTATPPSHRSATPASVLNSTPAAEGDGVSESQTQNPPPPPPLPTSIQPGKPLPTVEDAQPEDLPSKEYQSFQESGVLAESLSRSRQRWISDGLFEKYWAKPFKKKGVIQEDPKNPPKESMTKVGQVTISLEPHYFEATMYAVKAPNKPVSQPVFRPILQYGPPNGTMPPPPPPPSSKPATPTTVSAPATTPATVSPTAAPPTPSTVPPPTAAPPSQQKTDPQAPTTGPPSRASHPQPQPQSQSPSQSQSQTQPPPSSASPAAPTVASAAAPIPQASKPAPPPSAISVGPAILAPALNRSPAPVGVAPTPPQGPPRAAPPQPPHNRPSQPVPGTDPIIVTLAEKANEDPQLRDLMKRVANGNAPKEELARFQAIIDQITAESKKKGALQGPSAERLFVDGKTVRYFADEVDVIVSIILRTNPKQTSADLTPPANSNALVVELVKTALDDKKTLDRVQRIARATPEFSDATDLKETLERLKSQLGQQRPQSSATSSRANGATNGQTQSSAAQQPHPQSAPQQALRSKGPPPAVKPDVSAVVFEFAGGSGDRYLFPKFSIVEQIQTSWGPQVIASFLIVRKGSTSEYGGDPKLDYYQPVTIRISASQPRYLDYFTKVVAPQDEVRRYMEDIMDNMTRAEYVLLAMRLPKPREEAKEDGLGSEKENKLEESKHATPEVDDRGGDIYRKGLTWKKDKTMKLLAKPAALKNGGKIADEEDSYRSFIATVTRKRTEDEEQPK